MSDASAERSAAGCTIKLGEDSVAEYLRSNITLLRWMIAEGYGDVRTLERRVQKMEEWLANPSLMSADADAEYAAIIEIDLADINEPIVCCPNDPDDARLLSEVAGDKVDEIFIGSCMTNIGHFRAAGKLLDEAEAVNTRLICPNTYGCPYADGRRLLQYLRAGRRTNRDARLLAMHGQPSTSYCRYYRTVNVHSELPESSRRWLKRISNIS